VTRTASWRSRFGPHSGRGANTVALDGRRRDGGHRRGDVASRIAVQSVAQTLLPLLTSEIDIPRAIYHDELRAAIGSANQAIIAEATGIRSARGWGRP